MKMFENHTYILNETQYCVDKTYVLVKNPEKYLIEKMPPGTNVSQKECLLEIAIFQNKIYFHHKQ